MEIIVLVSLFIFIFVGYLLIKAFSLFPLKSNLLLFSCSFGLGTSVIAFQLYIYSRLGIFWSLFSLLLPWIILGAGVFGWRKKRLLPLYKIPKLKKADIAFVGLIGILLTFVAFESTLRPVVAWDAWAIWLLKSKIFFLDGSIQIPIFRYVESSYPILVSLMYTFLYVAIGYVDDRSVLLLSFAFYLMQGIGFFAFLKEKTSITFGLIGTFLLLSTQNILRHGGRLEAGQADIILAFYMLITGVVLIEFLSSKKLKIVILLQLLLGITALIKNEGLAYSIFVQLIVWVSIIQKKKPILLLASVFWVIPVIDWEYFKLSNNIPKLSEVFVGSTIHFSSMLSIMQAMISEFTNIQNWNLLWILFFAVIFLYNTRVLKSTFLPLYVLIFLQLGLFFSLYMIFPNNPVDLVNSSFNRLLLQIAPLALLVSLLEVYPSIRTIKIVKKFV